MYAGATKKSNGDLKGWSEHSAAEWAEQSVFSVKQDVRLLNENIVPVTFIQALRSIIEDKGISAAEIDYFLPHISSMYFYDKLNAAMIDMGFEIPQKKWFTNLATKGNTGSASIYIMVDELVKSGRLKCGDKLLCFIPESGRFSSSFMLLSVV
jgi:3-oxoacyl-[acyl-carrier-protein] synthase-3